VRGGRTGGRGVGGGVRKKRWAGVGRERGDKEKGGTGGFGRRGVR